MRGMETYLNNTIADTERGPSPALWAAQGSNNGWIPDFLMDPRLGQVFFEDFKSSGISPASGSALNYNADQSWYAYLDTNGAITDAGIVGGGINLAASNTAHQGVALGQLTNAFQIVDSTPNLQGRLIFECRVSSAAASLAASKTDYFIGLIDASGLPASAVPITGTGGALSTSPGLIGFHKRGGSTHGTDWDFVYQVAGGTAVYETNLGNIVTTVTGTAPVGGTYYKLGFDYNPLAIGLAVASTATGQTLGVVTKPMLKVFVNGLAAVCFLDSGIIKGTTFPNTIMSPAVAWKQQSTTASVSANIDWLGVVQQFIA